MVEFQPRTLITLDLISVSYRYVQLLDPNHPPLLPSDVLPPHPYSSVLTLHSIICPPGRHLSASHHTKKPVTLPSLTRHHQVPTLLLSPRPQHACHIPVAAAHTLLPKYLLAWSSAVVPHPSIATTACTHPPIHHIPSPSHRPRILAVGPPTPLPLPDSCSYIPKEVWSLPPGVPYLTPCFSKSHPPSFDPSSPSPAAGNPRVPPCVLEALLLSTPRFFGLFKLVRVLFLDVEVHRGTKIHDSKKAKKRQKIRSQWRQPIHDVPLEPR